MKLIIVESPNKIKKIKGYAGPDYEVAASVGHIRDLPVGGADIGIDREHGHALKYIVSDDKKSVVANLRRLAKTAGPQGVYLATDPDREGEAIAFHLCEVLGLDPRTTKRIAFQEITEKAIKAALAAPTTVDLHLVHAQEGRRAVDRLVGFTISPVLNRKLAAGLSAGRVQSVAVRLVVERERQIQQFTDTFTVPVVATLQTSQGEQLRARRTAPPFAALDEGQAYLLQIGRGADFGVLSVEKKPVERQPAPAFSTSTLQQEGVKKLRFTVQKVSDLAQKLFEGGHITYIRTDSVNLGEEATRQAQAQITAQFGAGQFQARQTKNKDGAQEAHEAIRPTHWEQAQAGDTPDEQALYRMIYSRALASQMLAAQYDQTTIALAPAADAADTYTSSTRVLTRAGYLAVYQDAEEEGEEPADDAETTLKHPVQEGEALTLVKLEARQSFARPAKRYNEATLVADLEKQGIGRPSTYASILRTIFARQYISTGSVAGKKLTAQVLTWQGGQLSTSQRSETLGADKDKLLPTATGTQVTEFLERNFPKVMDYKFTAGCEAVFDKIARGQQTYQQFVPMFDQNLLGWVAAADQLTPDRAELQKRLIGQFEGTEMLVGTGKNGPYILHAEKYYNIPESITPAQLSEAQARDLISQRRASAPREVGLHEGKPVVVGQGPKGVYLKWREQYFNVPAGISAAAVTPVLAVNYLIKAQAEAAKNVLATVGKYTIGRNEWGLYVTDGEVKAKFKPDCTEEQARTTTAEQAAEMIKSYKAWKKKNAGRK
ncbi:type I DNA topoisomerase [Hymenobacter ruricola]|uniref:DNA topoisomerase 1 n=1 Tax=Hymenobacter ruricola TaxID=2791023 RepID=A0ABS0I8T1_9BACT|nr:type I DNA topoisomerase [Hymenobacter ruricola]MBF9223374.1 type I DNA topoisomerase [Hymenobacter ruricola]